MQLREHLRNDSVKGIRLGEGLGRGVGGRGSGEIDRTGVVHSSDKKI